MQPPSGPLVLLVDDESDLVEGLRGTLVAARPLAASAGMVTLDPAWSPSGGQVAYVRAVSRGNTWGWSTCASPQACGDRAAQQAAADRALAAWVRTRTLWLAAPDGSGAHELGHAGPGVYYPVWSRNGHHLLYVRSNSIWLLDARGGAPVRIAGPLLDGWTPFGFYGHVDWSQVLAWRR